MEKEVKYKIIEVFNEHGKDIKIMLRETFKEYCESILEKNKSHICTKE